MGDEIKTIKLPPSCITSNNEPCPIQIEVDNLESGDKELIKSNLFFILSSMDSIITESIKHIEKGLPFYVRIILEGKNASKTMALNISDHNLNTDDILILGGLQIGIGVATEVAIGILASAGIVIGGWTLALSIGAAVIISYFLSRIYLYLKDKSLSLWQQTKSSANAAIQHIMSLIESDTRNLEIRKKEITEKAVKKILNASSQDKMTKKEYEECITYLCEHCSNKSSSNPKDSLDSLFDRESPTFLFPNTINYHRQGEIHFTFQILDEYTRMPIANARLQLQNINLGVENITDSNGLVSFSIKEREYLKPFRARLNHLNYYSIPVSDRSIIPNSIRRREIPFILRFNGKVHLYFNGQELSINNGNKVIHYFTAYSGKALSIKEREALKEQYGYENFVSYKDKENLNTISYFCLDKGWQKERDIGAIPEGEYYININQSKDDKSSGIREFKSAWYSPSRNNEKEQQWGKYNIPIYTDEYCTNTIESSTQRNNFFIHGGESYGNNGGINLGKEDNELVNKLESLKSQLIYTALDSKDKPMTIELLVDYTPLCISLDSITLERIINQDTNQHKVILSATYTKPNEMKEDIFNAQKQQTYWAYKEIPQTEEFNFEEVSIKDITFFQKGQKDYKGENIEINLVEYDWQHYNKQIIVFGFLDTERINERKFARIIKG